MAIRLKNSEKLQVIVAHPGRQHSHQLAMALENSGELAKYFTGIPIRPSAIPWGLRSMLGKWASRYECSINPSKVEHVFVATCSRNVMGRLLPKSAAVEFAHRADGWFDISVAKKIQIEPCNVVVGYENACLNIFKKAKRLGLKTVLDAASVHHQLQDKVFNFVESESAHRNIITRKNEEIELADQVLTVSEMARQSYIDSGCAPDKVTSIPMGVDLQIFKSDTNTSERKIKQGVRFVFVGNGSPLKGCDILAKAFRRLLEQFPESRLTIIGGAVRSTLFEGIQNLDLIEQVSHEELARILFNQDVLVLPSRFDSFGMVVAEGMACGLPAIVSDHVGAKEMIIPGSNGHVIRSECVDSLLNAMHSYSSRPFCLKKMRVQALDASQRYSWNAYRERAASFFQNFPMIPQSYAANCG